MLTLDNEKIVGSIAMYKRRNSLTDKDVADQLHMSKPTYYKIKYGKKDLKIGEISALAELLNTSIYDLLKEVPDGGD